MKISDRIKKANLIQNPLNLLPDRKTFVSDNYEISSSGWDKQFKLNELFDKNAFYLIVYNESKPVGYSHFRFDMDFDNEVIYCYELQIEEEFRRFGLGKFLMEILENLCENLELEKVMLTVSKHNKIGQSFFKTKMKYSRDETDINDQDPNIDYEILSKVFWEES